MTSTLQNHQESLHAYLLDGNGGTRTIPADEIPTQYSDKESLWIHLNYDKNEDVKWLNESSGLDPLVISALLTEETRPRTTSFGDGLLIMLRGINLNPQANPEDMVSIRVWVDSSRVITTRKRDLLSVSDLLTDFKQEKGPCNSSELLVELINRLIWQMNDTVDDLEDQVAEFEEQVLTTNSKTLRYELSSLRRQAISIRRYLAPQREALSRLINEKVKWLDDENRSRLREISDRLIRYIEDIDSVRERAALTQEELQNRFAEQMNSRMYVLSVVAAVFLPLGFLTGLLGINVGGIPGTENNHGFSIFSGLLVAVVIIQIIIFRWKKWM